MNNASYVTLFEEARWDLITERGYGLDRVIKSNVGPIILSFEVEFLKELKARDRINITTQVQSFKGKVGVIDQEMIKDDGSIACRASFKLGMFDLNKRKLVTPTEDWLLAFADKK